MADVGIAEDKIIEATGHGRGHWYGLLDGYGDVDHTTRTKRLGADAPGLPGWWVQTLTVDYERERGLREVGQSCAGDYQVGCSKTLPGDPVEAYERIVSTPFLPGADWTEGAVWDADGAGVEVRRADPGKMLRWFWHDDDGKSTVEIHFAGKPNGKTSVTVRHHQLASSEAREHYRAKWKAALDQIAA